MIIVKLSGGLGNQMFQFAAAFALSLDKKSSVVLDLSSYNSYALHNGFELNRVFKKYMFLEADESDVQAVFGRPFNYKFFKLFKLEERVRKLSKKYIFEVNFDYKDDFFDIPDNSYLDGYWQSYLYFYKFSDHIKNIFSFSGFTDHKNIFMKNKILSFKDSVSIHFRRGDYVSDIKTNSYHGVCDLEYYEKAINFFLKKNSLQTFFMFSDDIEWVKTNLSIKNANYIFVNHNFGLSSFNDMALMSLCKHNIIANSTFSWWGAWLNSNPNKIVVYPKKWFADKNALTLCPPDWISF